ncbi:MAG: GAF domain-containing protein [Anaerolineaceae bacterium]|nr:MAG: GAF domain-containing protein [Anaerolineaceae bacterium]
MSLIDRLAHPTLLHCFFRLLCGTLSDMKDIKTHLSPQTESSRFALRYRALLQMTPVIIALTALVLLMSNIPDGDLLAAYGLYALVYAALTGFALYFAVLLSGAMLGPAHAGGMVAFLSLPADVVPLSLWAVTAGALVGVLVRYVHKPAGAAFDWRKRAIDAVMVTSRITISFAVAAAIYLSTGAALPMDTGLWVADSAQLLALFVYVLAYFLIYTAIYTLELYVNRQPVGYILKHNRMMITAILVLPVPFAILSAEVTRDLFQPAGVIGAASMALIFIGLHGLSRSEQQTRRQLDEMTTLSTVTRAMRSHLDIHELLETIYSQVITQFDVSDFTLLLYSDDRLRHVLVLRDGERREEVTLDDLDDRGLLRYVLDERRALFLLDDNERKAFEERHKITAACACQAWLGVPLVLGVTGYGVIAMALRTPNGAFTVNDTRLLSIVADSACIAIENAVLFSRQKERAARLSTLNRVSTMLSGTLSAEKVLDTVIESARVLGEAQAVALYLYMDDDDDTLSPSLASAHGMGEGFASAAPEPMLIDGNPLYEKYLLAVGDILEDAGASHLRGVMEADSLRSLVEIPLFVGQSPVGVLVIFYTAPQRYSEERLEILRAFGTQAAQAINNSRAYAVANEAFQRSVEQLLALAGIGRRLTASVNLRAICDLVLEHVMDSTHAQAGLVLLLPDADSPRVLSHTTVDRDMMVDLSVAEAGITRRVLDSGKMERIDDVFLESWFEDNPRLIAPTRAQLAVPILRGADTLGVIMVESVRANGFSEEDSHFVAQVANQAVIAIDNARLFERITQARDRLQVILDTMEEALLLIDDRGRIALANPRLMSLLDISPSDLIEREIGDAADDTALDLPARMGFAGADDLLELVQKIGVENAWPEYPPHLYMVSMADGGRRYIQRYIIPVLDESIQTMGVLLVFYDKTHEQELSRTREELMRMIVHDLRAPLLAVVTGLRLIERYVPADNPAYEVVQSTAQSSRQAVHKLLSRVDSLLDIAKMQSGRLTIDRAPVHLRDVVDAVGAELRPLAQDLEISIEADIPPDLPALYVDRDKVERLLLNLLDNALKYSPTRQKVIVRANVQTESDASGFVRVQVIDRGPGIPSEYRGTLFDSFVQVQGNHNVRRGFGLGLSFCRMVAEAHGGHIWLEDNQPAGSIFAFTLPLCE